MTTTSTPQDAPARGVPLELAVGRDASDRDLGPGEHELSKLRACSSVDVTRAG